MLMGVRSEYSADQLRLCAIIRAHWAARISIGGVRQSSCRSWRQKDQSRWAIAQNDRITAAMALVARTYLTDDLDGSEDDMSTVRLALDKVSYEIDL